MTYYRRKENRNLWKRS